MRSPSRYTVAQTIQPSFFRAVVLGLGFGFLVLACVGAALARQDAPSSASSAKTDQKPPADAPGPDQPKVQDAKKPPPAKSPSKPASQSKSKAAPGEEPRMLTKSEAEARKRSPFLRPPGSTDEDSKGYDVEDARDLPPWNQVSFFGITARGRFFIYVIDQSGSMIDDDRLTRASIELRRSVFALQSPQQFEVIAYNDEATAMPGGPIPRTADQRNKELLRSWLRLIDPDGGTSPRSAILKALALRPDAVFLLSDGDFPEGTVEDVARANVRNLPIHCVDMAAGLAGDSLQRIARESGGRYVSRPGFVPAGR